MIWPCIARPKISAKQRGILFWRNTKATVYFFADTLALHGSSRCVDAVNTCVKNPKKAVMNCEYSALAKSESRKICVMFYSAFYCHDDLKIFYLQHSFPSSSYRRPRSDRLCFRNYLNDKKQRQIFADTALCYTWPVSCSLDSSRNTVSSLN